MEVEIISTTENKLFERKEINAALHFENATPTRKEMREAISTKLGLNPELTVLSSVVNEFGNKRVRVIAHAYKDIKKLMEIEPLYIRKRDGVGVPPEAEKPKKEAAAPAEKKESKK
jgi:ribosomal protein S24E